MRSPLLLRNPLLLGSTGILLLLLISPAPAASQEVIGISAILSTTNSTHIDTYSATEMDATTAFYYDAYVEGYLFQNNAEIASGYAYGNPTAAGGFTKPLTLGDTYEIDSYHYLVEYYSYTDGINYYYSNPLYYLNYTGGGSGDASGTGYFDGGGPAYYTESYIFLGYTAVALPMAVPAITSISPTSGSVGSSGTITVQGNYLEDWWTQTTTPAITGSGMTLSVKSVSPTQVTLGFTIPQSASTGAHNITLSTRFGTSNAVSFNVGDPTPTVTSVSPSTWQAGTNVNITITGSGFGTNPTVTLIGMGVLVGPVTGSDGQISTSVTVAPDAPDETVTVQVQSTGYGSGFFATNPDQSSTGSNTATVIATPAPVPQIKFGTDTSACGGSGANIAGTTQPFVVGQQVALVGCVTLSANLTISGQNWSNPPGTAVGGYNVSASNGSIVPLPNTSGSSFTYYWVDSGNSRIMTYTYTMSNGQSNSASTTFNVDGPTGVNIVTYPTANTLAPVNVINMTMPQGTIPYLELGNGNGQTPATYGIVLQASATYLPSNPGWYEWVQLINADHIRYLDSNSKQWSCLPKNWNAQPQLDTVFPYSSGTANSQAGAVTSDSPATPLSAEIAQNFGATMYLMWDPAIPPAGQSSCTPATVSQTGVSSPSTCASIPVPIGYVSWTWAGDAVDTLSTTTGDNGTTGHLRCGPNSANSFVQDSTYPQWSNFVLSGASLSQAFSCSVQ